MCANTEINKNESRQSCEGDIHSTGRVRGVRDCSREELTFKPRPLEGSTYEEQSRWGGLVLGHPVGPAK